MRTLTTIDECRDFVAAERAAGRTVALVPTMGALHAGHLSLIDVALAEADTVVASIFVNPLQFGPNEDFDRYPRSFESDLEQLAAAGTHAVFAPSVNEMYPDGKNATTVSAGHIGTLYEGRSRPGHFDGMLTVVLKLLQIVSPDVACFGEKDAQQLFLIRRMVREFNLPMRIVGVPIVRDADGLALSSRNAYLGSGERQDALALSRALAAVQAASDRGVEPMLAAAQSVLQADSGAKLDYLVLVDPETFAAVGDAYHGHVLALIAARVGSVRLIDNALTVIP